jgi:hypothetical protein
MASAVFFEESGTAGKRLLAGRLLKKSFLGKKAYSCKGKKRRTRFPLKRFPFHASAAAGVCL